MKVAFFLLIVLAVVNGYSFSSTQATVTFSNGVNRYADVKVNTDTKQQEFIFSFGTKDLELYNEKSRYQTCTGGACKNIYMAYPFPLYGSTGPNSASGGTIAGISTRVITYTQDGVQVKVWYDQSNAQRIVRVYQGGSIDRTVTFTNFVIGAVSFSAKPACQSVQCGAALDLVMVIDGSGSITNADYKIEMDYAKSVVDAFSVGPNGVHVGLVTFATTAAVKINLSSDSNTIKNQISAIPQMQGETNIGDAILTGRQVFSPANGGRGSQYPKVMLVLTDGRANRPPASSTSDPIAYMIQQADAAKAEGIKIYAVGVGNQVNQDDLNLIATQPTATFTSLVGSFQDLKNTIDSIISEVCVGGEANPCNPACPKNYQCACETCQCGLVAANCGSRGTFNSNSCQCECQGYWSNGSSGNVFDCSVCSITCAHGTKNSDTCTCDCTGTGYTGDTCSECAPFTCGPNQEPVPGTCGQCRCKSNTGWGPAGNCLTCQTSFCNNNGVGNANCDGCICNAGFDAASKCKNCNFNCNNHGSTKSDCSGCVCNANSFYSPSDNCLVCNLDCANGATKNSACTACNCPSGTRWSGIKCDQCTNTAYCGSRGTLDQSNCRDCICNAGWTGTRCDTCTIDGLCKNGSTGDKNRNCQVCACKGATTGTYCDQCDTSVCKNGGVMADCTVPRCTCPPNWTGDTCNKCNKFWTGTNCDVCDNGGAAESYLSPQCNNHGRLNSDCTACICEGPWKGATCNDCQFDCNGNGDDIDSTCDGCVCRAGYDAATDCLTCDVTSRDYCNGRGVINNPDTGCNQCQCDVNAWGGQRCTTCTKDCNNNGRADSTDCTTCVCDPNYHSDDDCKVCHLECFNNGTAINDCTTCSCLGGYTAASQCQTCDAVNYLKKCKNNADGVTPDCQCDCSDRFDSTFCTNCPLTASSCNSATGQGSVFNGIKNGINECRCKCIGFWDGEDCEVCSLDPVKGSAICDGIGEPRLSDCTCHCPNYYRDEEGCRDCIITLEDCVHRDADTTVDTTAEGCTCKNCEGNWSGRDCSKCDHVCTEDGFYINKETCVCEPRCGDDFVVANEECELSLISNPNNKVCCDKCKLVTVPCDDGIPCTFDDRCLAGVCTGVENIDFEIDQDRNPLPLGSFNKDTFRSRWGIAVTTVGTVDLNVVDSATTSDNRFRYPSASPYGGDNTFGKILTATSSAGAHSVTFTFSPPRAIQSTVLLSVSRTDTTVVFACQNGQSVTRTAVAWGVGSMSQFGNPCTGNSAVSAITFNNPGNSAFGGFFPCSTPYTAGLGRLGDYVWHDFTVDNIQDSYERGISSVRVVLKLGDVTIASTTTDQNGGYIFESLYGATYTVEFYGPENYRFTTPQVVLFSSFVLNNGALRNIVLPPQGENLTADVGMYLYGSIGDLVFLDDNRNGLQDEAVGIPNVLMELFYEDDLTQAIRSQNTTSTGAYKFEFLPVYRTATTFSSYMVRMTAPSRSIITIKEAGSNRAVDSDINPTTGFSNRIPLTPSARNDFTIDGGIYYCCGSIGDRVFIDSNKDGLQTSGEVGVANVEVTLLRDDIIYGTTQTNATGFYLFSGLPLSGSYQVHFGRPTAFVFTRSFIGGDRAVDSNAGPDGFTDLIQLTPAVPDVLTIDAGIKEGCETSEECSTVNACESATCINSQCVFQQLRVCPAPTNVCFDAFCDSKSGDCLAAPTLSSTRSCNDNNPCTSNDKCEPGTGVCKGTGNSLVCDDGNPCTSGDFCRAAEGVCRGTPTDCNIGNLNPCIKKTCNAATGKCDSASVEGLCNDNNACTINDMCAAGVCVGEPKACSTTQACKESVCTSSGVCSLRNLPDNSTCSDNNDCTVGDSCRAGVCTGITVSCTPLSQCHSSTCSFGLCSQDFKSNVACDDGNACTENDICDAVSQTCKGTPKTCVASSPCAQSICVGGTCSESALLNAVCDDGDKCTVSTCEGTKCVNTRVVCDDGNVCTDDTCDASTGACLFTANTRSCNDGDKCTTIDACVDKVCVGVPVTCGDENVCTDDSCDPATGDCVHTANTKNCDDKNACTPTDVCSNMECVGFDATTCADRVTACQVAECNVINGGCDITDLPDDTPCDDGNSCTENDVCTNGQCAGTQIECTGSQCASSSCVDGQCQTVDISGSCDDSNACTTDDLCVRGVCVGTPTVCDDENLCTDDSCDANGVCQFVNNADPCDDGNACTVDDVCLGGVCGGEDFVCVSTDVCIDLECVDQECMPKFNSAPCDDGNACTTDVCVNGVCVGTVSVNCGASSNPCRELYCDTSSGACLSRPIANSCDDGNFCTINDSCVNGVCTGAPRICTGENVCEEYFCNTATNACDTRPNSASCDDGNSCTQVDSCINGQCVGADTKVCSTDNACKASTCDVATGNCVETNISGSCSDNNACTENDRCEAGACVGDLAAKCIPECVLATDCLEGNACQTASCVGDVCIYTDTVVCENEPPCLTRTCDTATGQCVESFTDLKCNDGNACTQADFCQAGTCVGTQVRDCPVRDCRVGVCDPTRNGECVYTITAGASCDDGNDCTLNDVCGSNGVCTGAALECSSVNPCMKSTCSGGQCVESPANGKTCSDGNSCTKNDRCDAGVCKGEAITCSNPDPCLESVCSAATGKCVDRPVDNSCDDGNACTEADTCFNGKCAGVPIVCDSDNVCLSETCVAGKCVALPVTSACDDGDDCTVEDVCAGGICSGKPKDCSAFDSECAVGFCSSGDCVSMTVEKEGSACGQDNLCAESGTCEVGECKLIPKDCSSSNPCSIGSCDPAQGCVFVNNPITCDDSDDCSISVCLDQVCTPTQAITCNDGNPCTVDSCDPSQGCIATIDTSLSCSDGDSCTVDECTPEGTCKSTPIDCDDGNVCTQDVCLAGKCTYTPTFAACELDQFCVAEAQCDLDMKCSAIRATGCPATENPCSVAVCSEEQRACVEVPVAGDDVSCDDGNACTVGEVCQEDMTCGAGDNVVCPVLTNPCQESVCDALLGCTAQAIPGDCSNDDPCSTQSCEAGQCVSTPVECVDNDDCTYDHVCGANGCEFEAFSCRLSPCVYTVCDGQGKCKIDENVDNWSPRIYFAMTDPAGTHFVITASSSDYGAILSSFVVTDPIRSIQVEPMSGTVYAIGGSTGKTLFRIPKFANGTLNSNMEVVVNELAQANLDLSFKPTLKTVQTGYSYQMYGLGRSDSSLFSFGINNFILSQVSDAPRSFAASSWDNHGQAFYGVVGKQVYAWDPATKETRVMCDGQEALPSGAVFALEMRVNEKLIGLLQDGEDLNIFSVDVIQQNGREICDIRQFNFARFAQDDNDATFNILTAAAFDDTVCVLGLITGGSNGGATTGTTAGSTGTTGTNGGTTGSSGTANLPPAPQAGAGANAGNAFPGQSDVYVLTGTTGQISTAVVGVVGAGSVAVFAIFAVIFGMNNTKKDTVVPLGAVLEGNEASSLAAENPLYNGTPGAFTNITAA